MSMEGIVIQISIKQRTWFAAQGASSSQKGDLRASIYPVENIYIPVE